MKKFLVLTILLLAGLLMCGCGEIEVSRYFNRDSSVTDRVVVRIDEDVVNKYYDLEYVENIVEEYFTINNYSVIEDNDNSVVIAEIFYPTRADFEEQMGNTTSDEGFTKGFLFSYQESTGSTPFAKLLSTDTVEKLRELHFSDIPSEMLGDIRYKYTYATPYKSVKSDAIVTYENRLYVHRWDFSEVEARAGSIYLKQTVPNNTGWYLISILTTLAITAVGFIIVAIKQMRKKENIYG